MAYANELVFQVVSSLLRNKLRSFLTMAGIAWGVASIVLIVAMGDGFKEGQRKNTAAIGENIVIVFHGRTEMQAGGQRAGRRIRLEYRDVNDLRAEAYMVERVTAELQSNSRAVSAFNSGSFNTLGVEANYNQVRTLEIGEGRFFLPEENREARRVCVIGANVRKQLFGERTNVLGAQIALNGLPFAVIGLPPKKEQNSSYNGLDDDKIFVPYQTMLRDLPPKDSWWKPGVVSDIMYVPRSITDWEATQRQVRKILARNHDFNPLDERAAPMWDTVENAQMVDGIFTSMTAFLGIIALVTLTLGGVGVMNIMLVTVSERTREIGLRKAVGATRFRILLDFLVEGLVLAGGSGLIGWGAAYGMAAAVNSLDLKGFFAGLPVSGETSAMAFSALLVVALASSLWPAWRAASLTPVEALRYER